MRESTSRHTIRRVARGVMAMGLLLGVTLVAADRDRGDRGRGDRDRDDRDREDTLIVWASDKAHNAPDFLAIIDFDRESRTYGQVLRTVPLTGASAVGNEPHHVGLSRDGRTLALGGLLSALRPGQDQVFFFDVDDPRNPTFIRSDNPPGASITDEFAPLENGGFLVTFMGGATGTAPGRVVEYDAATEFVQAWPAVTPDDGFNPHGLSIDESHNLMVTSDFICPLRTLHDHGGVAQVRGSVRVWDLAQRAITRTIAVGAPGQPAGTMEVQLIPHDRRLRAFTAGMIDGKLYLVDPQDGTATAVFDFNVFATGGVPSMPQLLRLNREGTRLFVTLNGAGKVVMFDVEQPRRPKPLSVVNLGADSGPHFLRLTKDERRLVVSNYFLVEDLAPGGIVNVEGDHKIHVIDVRGDRLERDRDFDVDFDRDISTGPARPHGVVMLRSRHHCGRRCD